jgi:hypothetical protein
MNVTELFQGTIYLNLGSVASTSFLNMLICDSKIIVLQIVFRLSPGRQPICVAMEE